MDLSKYYIGQILKHKDKVVRVVGLDPSPKHPASSIKHWNVLLVEYNEETKEQIGERFFLEEDVL